MIRYKALQEKVAGKIRIDGYNITVYKNSQTLKNFPKGVRGVITPIGDLLVWDEVHLIHRRGISALRDLGLIDIPREVFEKATGWLDVLLPYCCPVQENENFKGMICPSMSLRKGSTKVKTYFEKAFEKCPDLIFIPVLKSWSMPARSIIKYKLI